MATNNIFEDSNNDLNTGLQFTSSPINFDNDTTTNIADDGGQVITGNSGPVAAGTGGSTVAGDDINSILAKDSTVLQNSSVDGSLAANNGGVQFAAQDGGDLGPIAFGKGSQATEVEDSTLVGSNAGVGGDVQQIQGNEVGPGGALAGRDAVADNDTSLSFSNEENNLTNVEGSSNVNTAQDDATAAADQDDVAIDDSGNSFSDDDNVVKAFAGDDLDLDF